MTAPGDDAALWSPSPDRVAGARLWDLLDLVNDRHGAGLARDYDALHAWSVANPGEFWAAVWDVAAVPGERGGRLLEAGADLPSTRFLPDARLNVAEALLARGGGGVGVGGGEASTVAMAFTGEDGETAALTWTELRLLVGRLQAALRAAGVGSGDRVAAVVTNRPEAYALMAATASVGAVFTSVSPDFGADGILDRFAQVTPSLLVGVGSYVYGGRRFDVRPTLATIAEVLPSLRAAVMIAGAGVDDVPSGGGTGWVTWDDWLAPHPAAAPSFERFPFDHPWYVLYSSGTTGRPKCIVHRAGGVLLKHLAEHQLQHDLGPADRLCYFTTAGWMMWNWQASALASGTSLVLYDGSPFHPDGNRLFELARDAEVTALGVSPRFLDAVRQAGLRPADTHPLPSLHTLFCTGSPLAAETARFVYDAVAPDVHLAPISGGTDLCGVIIGAEPTSPVWPGEMQGAALGMAADIVDQDGASVPAGERGELVVRNAFPSMPLRFWGDDDGSRYRAAYFERFPGLWHHGDFAERTEHGGWVISGRSDATLNPGGVRIGTAEIYRQVAEVDGVVESLAIGQEAGGDTRIVLFVQLAPGLVLDDALRDEIRARIRSRLSPRHVPAVVVQAPDLPRTRSGKLSELAVRDVVNGRQVANTSALANPESLDFFADVAELRE
jgi:acetoacetyl-CoA synthetase